MDGLYATFSVRERRLSNHIYPCKFSECARSLLEHTIKSYRLFIVAFKNRKEKNSKNLKMKWKKEKKNLFRRQGKKYMYEEIQMNRTHSAMSEQDEATFTRRCNKVDTARTKSYIYCCSFSKVIWSSNTQHFYISALDELVTLVKCIARAFIYKTEPKYLIYVPNINFDWVMPYDPRIFLLLLFEIYVWSIGSTKRRNSIRILIVNKAV